MKVLMVHGFYQQPGGEDQSFLAEARALEEAGIEVLTYTRRNSELQSRSRLGQARAAIWNSEVFQDVGQLVVHEKIDVVHVQNNFPLISPAVYYAAKEGGAAVVQSIRNYRLACIAGTLFRDGRVCTDCVGRAVAVHGIIHGCYRGSRTASLLVASMQSMHSAMGTYREKVDVYVAISRFIVDIVTQSGIPREKIVVKPNCVAPDPGPGDGSGHFALFVGRLTPEKGLRTLLSAWREIGGDLPLKIVGDGADRGVGELESEGVEWIGRLAASDVLELMGAATVVIVPSVWYEPFGRVAIEAYAKGTPVIASRVGGLAELVKEGETGYGFESDNPASLVEAVRKLLSDPNRLASMRSAARAEYLASYTGKQTAQQLIRIYERALSPGPSRD